MPTLRVATTQLELRAENSCPQLIEHMDTLAAQAAAGGAEVVIFPELVDTGLLGTIEGAPVIAASLRDHYWNTLPAFTDEIVAAQAEMANRHRIDILGGSLLRIDAEGHLRNTAYFTTRDGRQFTQDKIHLTPQEHELGMQGGDSVTVIETVGHKAGMLICADIQFPELSRYLSAKGAEVIFCPSLTWNSRGEHRVRTGCRARAMENQLFVVLSPLVGSSGLPADAPMHAVGEAVIATPVDKTFGLNDGLLGISGNRREETVLYGDLDFELLATSRAKPEAPGLALQRPDVYAKLLAE
ncbi:nitrilase-related carbon-nitrogen hydrolase [Brevibacterium sp.]|uniref:nitrilase-related carbon-nitrogen hydrolase n=1 Tax=Brevibacterium sp. TaxID=1701 RepID=UPI002810FF4F|nr:nitrilase-related carbon-nitrogen hydrolase [Brevibacterium sp.]